MFITSVKVSTIKIAAVLLALGAIIAVAMWSHGQIAVQADANPKNAGITTNQKRVQFLESYGWKVDAEPLEVMEVTIPKTFDAVYKNYNALQKKQGFDLTKYAGKRVKRWTYNVTNYPGVSEGVRANLLIYNDAVIGGDVSTVALDGFMQGLSMKNAGDAVSSPQEADITDEIFTVASAQ